MRFIFHSVTLRSVLMLQTAKPVSAAKYRDVCEVGVLEGGNCLGVRLRSTNTYAALEPQRGADGIDTDAGRFIRVAQIERSVRQRAAKLSQTKHGVQQNWQTVVNHINQQASPMGACLPELSLTFKQSYPTPMRATRLQQRCNPDARKDDAYTSFPSNLQIGEADGDAPV
ncbi:MAG: hypothetical protein ACREX0_17665 [Noviherbaspirillum sp.]